jgi:hypothetical protein
MKFAGTTPSIFDEQHSITVYALKKRWCEIWFLGALVSNEFEDLRPRRGPRRVVFNVTVCTDAFML